MLSLDTSIGDITIDMSGTADGFGPELSITPDDLTNMDVTPSFPVTNVFTIANYGATASKALATLIDESEFSVTSNECEGSILLINGLCEIEIEHTPSGNGYHDTTLQIDDSSVQSNIVQISGTASGYGTFSLDLTTTTGNPTQINKVDGGATDTVTFQVENTGTGQIGPLSTSIDAEGAYFEIINNFCENNILAASATCTLEVTVSSSITANRQVSGLLYIDDSVSSIQDSINISGESTGFSNGFIVYPLNINATVNGAGGTTSVTGSPVTLTIKNVSGGTSGTLNAITIFNQDKFTIMNDNCSGQSLLDDGTCTFDVALDSNLNGNFTEYIISTAITDGTISHSGTVILNGVASNFGDPIQLETPTSVSDIDISHGSAGDTSTITVRNISGSDIDTITHSFGGLNPNNFVVTTSGDGCTGTTVSDNNTCNIEIEAIASANGIYSATLNIGLSGNNILQVFLSGESTGYPSGPDKILDFMTGTLPTEFDNFQGEVNRSYINENGFIEKAGTNVPRFSYDPTTGNPMGLLMEGDAYQLIRRTNNFSHSNWVKSNGASITVDGNETSPIIGEDVYLFKESGTSPYELSQTTGISINSGDNTLSIFAKAKERSRLKIGFRSNPSATKFVECTFNLTGQVQTTSTDSGGYTNVKCGYKKFKNNWYRIWVIGTTDDTVALRSYFRILDESGSESYAGNPDYGLYLIGPQLESSQGLTSYFANTTGNEVVRDVDIASTTSNFSWYDNSTNEVTMRLNIQREEFGIGASVDQFKIHNPGDTQSIAWRTISGPVPLVQFNDGSNYNSYDLGSNSGFGEPAKVMFSQSVNLLFDDYISHYRNGLLQDKMTSGVSNRWATGLNRMTIGMDTPSSPYESGAFYVKELTYWKTKKPPETLEFASQKFSIKGVTGSYDTKLDNMFEINDDTNPMNITVHWGQVIKEDHFSLQIYDDSYTEICQLHNIAADSIGATLTGCSWQFGSKYYAKVTAFSNSDDHVSVKSDEIFYRFDVVRSCPENYIRVPAFDPYTNNDFCVAKYEMKTGTISEPDNLPEVNIQQSTAKSQCEAIDGAAASYQLISNAQWQTIARNIELNPENWDSNEVGSGQINTGNTDNDTLAGPAGALAASSSDDQDCFGTGEENDEPNGDHSCGGWHSQKRTHKLLNGEIIWDFGGNVSEWVRDAHSSVYNDSDSSYDRVFSTSLDYSRDQIDINDGQGLMDLRYHFGPQIIYTGNSSNNYAGMGVNDFQGDTGANPVAFRGGEFTGWASLISSPDFRGQSGIYTTKLTQDFPAFNWDTLGYRCVFEDPDL